MAWIWQLPLDGDGVSSVRDDGRSSLLFFSSWLPLAHVFPAVFSPRPPFFLPPPWQRPAFQPLLWRPPSFVPPPSRLPVPVDEPLPTPRAHPGAISRTPGAPWHSPTQYAFPDAVVPT